MVKHWLATKLTEIVIQLLASRKYDIQDTGHQRIAKNTIEGWLYTYCREGVEGLVPKRRSDQGKSNSRRRFREQFWMPNARVTAAASTN